jgi:hypothetical protein
MAHYPHLSRRFSELKVISFCSGALYSGESTTDYDRHSPGRNQQIKERDNGKAQAHIARRDML